MMSGILERDLTNEVTIGAGDDNVLMKFDYLLFYAGYKAEHKCKFNLPETINYRDIIYLPSRQKMFLMRNYFLYAGEKINSIGAH